MKSLAKTKKCNYCLVRLPLTSFKRGSVFCNSCFTNLSIEFQPLRDWGKESDTYDLVYSGNEEGWY